jgi:hypothetical protein
MYKIGSVTLIEQNNLNTKNNKSPIVCINDYMPLGLLSRSHHQQFTIFLMRRLQREDKSVKTFKIYSINS